MTIALLNTVILTASVHLQIVAILPDASANSLAQCVHNPAPHTNGLKRNMFQFHRTSRALPAVLKFLSHLTHKVCCVLSCLVGPLVIWECVSARIGAGLFCYCFDVCGFLLTSAHINRDIVRVVVLFQWFRFTCLIQTSGRMSNGIVLFLQRFPVSCSFDLSRCSDLRLSSSVPTVVMLRSR